MINFKTPELLDRAAVEKAVADSGYIGSDAGFANIYLLRKKYDTLLAMQEGFLFRYYNGQGSRRGYAIPLGGGELRNALDLIVDDAHESGHPLEFCLVDEPRAQILREYFANAGANRAEPVLHFEYNRGDSDYIYSVESLANLSGTTYRKKRNHISKFSRIYAHFELREITHENINDAFEIEKKWLNNGMAGEPCNPTCECEQDAWAERSEDEKSRLMEFCAIQEALQNFEALGMKGGVLYVEDNPVGMTIASEIAPGMWDIHFEKVIDEYAINGGYAVINKMFAERLVATGAKLINREEDIGLEGLRKAKLSYYPLTILDKVHVTYQPCDPNCHPEYSAKREVALDTWASALSDPWSPLRGEGSSPE